MASDAELLQKLTRSKAKKLELQTNNHLNNQLCKEVALVEEQLLKTEDGTRTVQSKEALIKQMVQSNEVCLTDLGALSERFSMRVVGLQNRLEQLSLSKADKIAAITQKATEKLEEFPKESRLLTQQDLVASLILQLATAVNKDEESCADAEKQGLAYQEARLKVTSEATALNTEIMTLEKEKTSLSPAIEAMVKIMNENELTYVTSTADYDGMKLQLSQVIGQHPDSSDVARRDQELLDQAADIEHAKRKHSKLAAVIDNLAKELEGVQKTVKEDLEVAERKFAAETDVLVTDFSKVEGEALCAEFELKRLVPMRDGFKKMLLRAHNGKSLDQLLEELKVFKEGRAALRDQLKQQCDAEQKKLEEMAKTIETELLELVQYSEAQKSAFDEAEADLDKMEKAAQDELDQLEIELQSKKCRLVMLEVDALKKKTALEMIPPPTSRISRAPLEVIMINSVEDEELVPEVPAIEGIRSFSPDTIKKREDRRRRHNRVVEHSLNYTDLSVDSQDGFVEKPKKKMGRVGRTKISTPKKAESNQKKKSAPVIQHNVPSSIRGDDSPNLSTNTEVSAACDRSHAFGSDEDSLDAGDISNTSADSLFGELRGFHRDIFLGEDDASHTLEPLTSGPSPPAQVSESSSLDDSLDGDSSLDTSVWD